jgi:hypothetical protein
VTLEPVEGVYAVARLAEDAMVPRWAWTGAFASVTRTPDELSIVCDEAVVPAGVKAERGFRLIRVRGTIDFAVTGVVSSLTVPLAEGGISVFVVSTHDTDYLLVKADRYDDAVAAWNRGGVQTR